MTRLGGQRLEPVLAGLALSIAAAWLMVKSGQPEALALLGGLVLLTYCVAAFDPPQLAYLAVIPMVFIPATIDQVHPKTLAYFGAVLVAALAAAVVRDRRLHWAWLLVFVLPTVSALASSSTPVELLRGVTPLVGLVAVTWLLLMVGRESPRALWRMIEWIALISIPVALLAIYQRATGTWPLLDDYARNTSLHAFGRSTGIFGHPIIYGLFSAAVLILAWFQRGRLWIPVMFAGTIGLVLSGARSAWLGLAIAALWLVIHRIAAGKLQVNIGRFAAGILFVVAVFVSAAVLSPAGRDSVVSLVNDRLGGSIAKQSTEARNVRSKLALEAIDANPRTLLLGHGPGASERFWLHFGKLDDGGAATFDNSYLTVAYDYGLLGLAVMLALIFSVIFRSGDLSGRTLMVLLAVAFYYFEWGGWPTTAALVAIAIATSKFGLMSPSRAARATRAAREDRAAGAVPAT
jgi:O-antigen ligase